MYPKNRWISLLDNVTRAPYEIQNAIPWISYRFTNQLGRRSTAKIESGSGTERARRRLREGWAQNMED